MKRHEPNRPMRFADKGGFGSGGSSRAAPETASTGSSAPFDFAKLLPDAQSREVAAQAAAVAHVGTMIYRARTRSGLSQDQLAAKCGMTQAHISELERGLGVNGPTMLTLSRIMRALGDEALIEAASERKARDMSLAEHAGAWLTRFTERLAAANTAAPTDDWTKMMLSGADNPFIAAGLAGIDLFCHAIPGIGDRQETKAVVRTIEAFRQELPLPHAAPSDVV